MTLSAPETQPDAVGKSGPRDRSVYIARITLAACLIFWVFVFSDSGWGPLLVPLSTQLHISLTTTGLLYVIWSTGYLPGALVGIRFQRMQARIDAAHAIFRQVGFDHCK